MLKRTIENSIKKWIDTSDDALLITGVRQCGKTFVIKKVLDENKIDYIAFNLIEQPEVIEVLKSTQSKDIKLFIQRLSLITNKKLTKGKTIIFFDEIQEYKEILSSIKFLVNEGSFKYILSGSLLGVEVASLHSAPVGFLKVIRMYPLDFIEFINALGVRKNTIDTLKNCFDNRKPVDDFVHKKMLDVFKIYLVVGGMPEAVHEYIKNNDFNTISEIHKKIIEQYRVDFTKYESVNKLKLVKTYNLIPCELSDKNKRFFLNNLDNNIKFDRYENSFIWLKDAGVSIPVFNITEPRLPLIINSKSSLFKLFLSDVGILSTLYGNATKLAIINDNSSLNAGAIYENYAAQELNSKDFNLYYFSSHKQGEVDFVIERDEEILPIEIKSGKDYTRHIALNNILNNRDYKIRIAYVFSNSNVRCSERIVYYPIYMISFIRNVLKLPKIPKLDMTGL